MKQKIITFGGQRRTAPARAQTAAAGSQKKRRRRRTGRQTLHYLLILLAAAAILAILSLTVFFKIEKLGITGNTKYADEEILAQSGVNIGDNLFRVSQSAVEKALMEKFPYIEGVKLKRSFPPRLTLEITQAKPLGAVNTAAGYVVIGRSGKVLETGVHTLPENVTVVNGMYLSLAEVGHRLGEVVSKGDITYSADVASEMEAWRKEKAEKPNAKAEDKEKEWRTRSAESEEENFKMLTYLVEAVEETGFGKITLVDFSDRLNMRIVYDGRILIELGSEADLPYKLKFVQRLLSDELPADYQGRLDASTASSSGQVWELARDISEELAKMQPEFAVVPAASDGTGSEPETSGNISQPDNPDLAVIPGSGSQASSSSSTEQSSSAVSDASQEASSSQASFNRADDLEVIPDSGSKAAGDTVTSD
ncbi:MAG: FtsQ-type POTRA domain-containing protein [Ruminococcaceae bacterium]|jgi:hypothetical protein|nr:FtsQ-type POTRA domain-containing protein [Oscillospiraceae bacterium]